nr:hypothetical protein [Tanacetum cinerariifolium]
MQQVQLIIWDEAPMTQKYAFEVLDKMLRFILGQNGRCGPVLHKHIRDVEILQGFHPYTEHEGDGTVSAKKKEEEDEATWIEIQERFLIKSCESPIEQIVKETYPDFTTRQHDDEYLKERAILTPRMMKRSSPSCSYETLIQAKAYAMELASSSLI